MDIKYSVGDVGAFKYLQGLCCVYESGKKNSSKLSDKPRSDYEGWISIAGILTIAAIILVLILLFSYTGWLKESYKRVIFAELVLKCRRE